MKKILMTTALSQYSEATHQFTVALARRLPVVFW